MRLRLATLLCTILLAGCSVPAERPAADPQAVATEAACLQRGGEWKALGRAAVPRCLLQTTDAGRACSDASQCEGLCLSPEGTVDGARVGGQCSVDTDPFGCQQRVRDGVASTLCVD